MKIVKENFDLRPGHEHGEKIHLRWYWTNLRAKNLGLGLLPGDDLSSDVSECGGLLEEQVLQPVVWTITMRPGQSLKFPLTIFMNLCCLLVPVFNLHLRANLNFKVSSLTLSLSFGPCSRFHWFLWRPTSASLHGCLMPSLRAWKI